MVVPCWSWKAVDLQRERDWRHKHMGPKCVSIVWLCVFSPPCNSHKNQPWSAWRIFSHCKCIIHMSTVLCVDGLNECVLAAFLHDSDSQANNTLLVFSTSHGLTGLFQQRFCLSGSSCPLRILCRTRGKFWKWLWVPCERVNADTCVLTSIERGTWIIVDKMLFFFVLEQEETSATHCTCACCVAIARLKRWFVALPMAWRDVFELYTANSGGFPLILRLWSAASINALTEQELRNGVAPWWANSKRASAVCLHMYMSIGTCFLPPFLFYL